MVPVKCGSSVNIETQTLTVYLGINYGFGVKQNQSVKFPMPLK